MKLPKGSIHIFRPNRKGTVIEVEQRELVLCGNCKHRYFADNRIEAEQRFVCSKHGFEDKPDDWFCADGEEET